MSQQGPLLLSYDGASPSVAEEAWVAPTATLIGPVTLHRGASVWFGAVLRADFATVTIGVDSNVQDNCVFHTGNDLAVTLGDRVSVGHNAVLHGCTVEDDVLVGMGATILNGSTVGSGSLIAAGAVVLEGTDVPPGSLVAGVPGKVRRPLSEEEARRVRNNAEEYVALSRRYADGRS